MSNENIVKVSFWVFSTASFLLASYFLLDSSANYGDLFIVIGAGISLGYLYQLGLKQIATFNKKYIRTNIYIRTFIAALLCFCAIYSIFISNYHLISVAFLFFVLAAFAYLIYEHFFFGKY